MGQKTIEVMVERWIGDEAFREGMRADPVGIAEREGNALSDDEKAALTNLDLSQPDGELARRASFET